ncbi:hypothetical protein B0T24DRAFT_42091 [Lasiosphaeria ovina]|uniref:Uncharacterized protein n=1 Tax=Lasiosphaeria ovina TaxID=92902 RepID=A0AAE0NKW4_9PEZI|nr:hypothetical protein B0T24DRAFT_42091 [Lasiosphaeria ovina]
MEKGTGRITLFNGSADFGPLPPSFSATGNGKGTPNLSAGPEDCADEFFDWPRYERDMEDVVTQSSLMDGDSQASPPALTTGSSVTALRDNDNDDDCVMTDVAPQAPELPIVWPKVSDAQLPREQEIHIFIMPSGETQGPSPPPTPNTGQFAPSPISHIPDSPSPPPSTRGRTVKKPEQTKKVRDKGACFHCRIGRVACDDDAVCVKCINMCEKLGGPLAQKICIRKTLSQTLGTAQNRWNWESQCFRPSLEQFIESRVPIKLLVSFPSKPGRCELEVDARAFKTHYGGGDPASVVILPIEGLSEERMYAWAASQVLTESEKGFQACVEELLQGYERNNTLDKAAGNFLEHKKHKILKRLMLNLLHMMHMWKIWSSGPFVIRQVLDNGNGQPTSMGFQSIQNHLRRHAEQAMSSLERHILGDIDGYLSSTESGKEDTSLSSVLQVAMWVSLWQIILIYRESLGSMSPRQQTLGSDETTHNSTTHKREIFRDTTKQLFDSVVVIYSEIFRSAKTLKAIRDAGQEVFGNDKDLHAIFTEAWRTRFDFCE